MKRTILKILKVAEILLALTCVATALIYEYVPIVNSLNVGLVHNWAVVEFITIFLTYEILNSKPSVIKINVHEVECKKATRDEKGRFVKK